MIPNGAHPTTLENTQANQAGGPTPPLLQVDHLSKAFGPVQANLDVSFSVRPSQVHALLGENGAGKSTLVKSLYGVHQPDSGQILINGSPVSIASPQAARNLGIGLVFQDMRLIPALTVWENIALYLQDTNAVLRPRAIRKQITQSSARWGLSIKPDARIDDLSIGEWQRVELLKVLMGGADLLILDEPTSVLTPVEVDALFEVVDHLRSDGVAVIIITHKLREVRRIADAVTVLRGGEVVLADRSAAEFSDDELIQAMVGRSVAALSNSTAAASPLDADIQSPAAIELRGVCAERADGTTALADVHVHVHGGEILGIAGVAGNGQDELVDVLTGAKTVDAGQLLVAGRSEEFGRPRAMRRHGVVCVVPNPVQQFVVPGLSIAEHTELWDLAAGKRPGGRGTASAAQSFADRADRVGLPVAQPDRILGDLSGGNIQRVLLTLAFSSEPDVLVLAYPTRGLDVATAQHTREAILAARDRGAAVVVVSEDLDELADLSDRVAVLADGRIAGELPRATATRTNIGQLMTNGEAVTGSPTSTQGATATPAKAATPAAESTTTGASS